MSTTPIIFILATRNRHKPMEVQAILGEGYSCRALADFPGAPEVAETADTFVGNATLKSVAIARWLSGLGANEWHDAFVLADDSGLEVDALNGAPGVHSARFAGMDPGCAGNSADGENNAKLLRLLKDVPEEKRSARFRCVLALTPILPTASTGASPVCSADEFEFQIELFEGTCEGRIGFAPRGQGGFGYDPLFFPNGFDESFAELGESVKNRISHRAKALAKLRGRFH